MRGEGIELAFELFDVLTGMSARADTANLTIVRVDDGLLDSVSLWEMIQYDPIQRRYTACVEIADLEAGLYDIYIGTSRDGVNRRVRIEVID